MVIVDRVACQCDKHGRKCEFPCWQRAGLTIRPCCPDCPVLYRDADGVDVEQDERWEHVAGSDFHPTSPDRVRTRGVVPAPTDRQGIPHPGAPVPPAGALNPFS